VLDAVKEVRGFVHVVQLNVSIKSFVKAVLFNIKFIGVFSQKIKQRLA